MTRLILKAIDFGASAVFMALCTKAFRGYLFKQLSTRPVQSTSRPASDVLVGALLHERRSNEVFITPLLLPVFPWILLWLLHHHLSETTLGSTKAIDADAVCPCVECATNRMQPSHQGARDCQRPNQRGRSAATALRKST
jgi:hypothetical protein